MNYTIELKINGNRIETVNKFFPKSQKLTLLLKTNETNIRNVKLRTGHQENYFVKDLKGFLLKLDRNMVKVGNNSLQIVVEKVVPNKENFIEVEYEPFELTLSEENISNPVESNLERLQHEIAGIIYDIID